MSQNEYSDLSVTDLLSKWRGGDEQALEQLMPKVYHELRRLAGSHLRGETRCVVSPAAIYAASVPVRR